MKLKFWGKKNKNKENKKNMGCAASKEGAVIDPSATMLHSEPLTPPKPVATTASTSGSHTSSHCGGHASAPLTVTASLTGGGRPAAVAAEHAPHPLGTPTSQSSAAAVHKRKDYAVRPGYSSGASSNSSFTSSDDIMAELEAEDGKEQDGLGELSSNGECGDNRHRSRCNTGDSGLNVSRHSDILALQSLRQDMMEGGDIAQAVVRIETPFGKPIEEIYDGVHDGPVLGSGASGIVRLITHRATGMKYAVKVLDLGLIDSEAGLRALRNEIFILAQLDHPNVVRIEEVYESTTDVYIVQELCLGGDLFDRLDEQPDYHYTEAQCARLVKQMLSSIRYLHSRGIIHRDLKLENFLFSSTAADSDLKMIDFGLSKHFELGQYHTEEVGTPYTVAPEIIQGEYDEKSDCWALGVITYLLLSGETPFGGLDGEDLIHVKDSILKARVIFDPPDVWRNVSEDAKDFVKRLLTPDAKRRPTAKEAQKLPWIQVWAKKDAKEGNKLNVKTVGALMAFKECSDMQKLLSEVLSFTLLPEQIVDLKKEFEKIDTEGVGEISLTALKQILVNNAEEGALGALTDQEIEDIFDAIRIRKSEPTIRWHEFLAAGLSQARVDDRNLRLAFDRLDNERKGFITFDDMQDLLGNNTEHQDLEKIWGDSLVECRAHLNRITFDDFKMLMKGQGKEQHQHFMPHHRSASMSHRTASVTSIGSGPRNEPGGGLASLPQHRSASLGSLGRLDLGLPPTVGIPDDPITRAMLASERSLDIVPEGETAATSLNGPSILTVSGASMDADKKEDDEDKTASAIDPVAIRYGKLRSRSFEQKCSAWDPAMDVSSNSLTPEGAAALAAATSIDTGDGATSSARMVERDASRAVLLPGRGTDETRANSNVSPLVINRALYRKHREMRMAVLDASKQFDRKRTQKQQMMNGPKTASLIMKRGAEPPVELADAHQRALFEAAARRCGRARRTRNKTVSDVTQLLKATS